MSLMSPAIPEAPTSFARVRFKTLILLFFFSGASALIYEVVWMRILVRVLGCTVYATSTVLAAFMSGLALGSYFFGKRADRIRQPLAFYAYLELAIAVGSLLVPFAIQGLVPVFQSLYAGSSPLVYSLLRFALVFLCLVIPTTMMGGTFPILARFFTKASSDFGFTTGTLYAANTWGAVTGVLASGIFLIALVGEFSTTLVAAGLNVAVAAAAYWIHKKGNEETPGSEIHEADAVATEGDETSPTLLSDNMRRLIAVCFGLSGFAALGYEVVWTRMLQFFLGTSVYAFTGMLSIYLIGIAWGSQWSRKRVDQWSDPVGAFAILEILISFFSVLGLWLLVPMDSESFSKLFGLSSKALAAIIAIFPTTFCLGALFPTVSRCFLSDERKFGLTIGRVYSTNTIGTILGSLAAGFILIPIAGTAGTAIALSFLNILIGISLFLTSAERIRRPATAAVALIAIVGAALFMNFLQDPFYRITRNRILTRYKEAIVFLHSERPQATVTAFAGAPNRPVDRNLWINGVGMTALSTETKLMAHLPILLNKAPKNVLIICFGMGTTLKSSLVHRVSVDVVELVQDTYDAFRFFHPNSADLLKNPSVRPHVNDGRNYLLMDKKTYDVITIDPAPPLESAGSVNLYSREFLTLAKDRLNPGGVVCLWVPPSRSTEVGYILSTFSSVFPHATMWRGPRYAGFYLVGTLDPLQVDDARFQKAFENEEFLRDLKEWNNFVPDANSLKGLIVLDEREFKEYVKGIPQITDNYPYTEFPLLRILFDPRASRYLFADEFDGWKAAHKK